MFVSPAIEKTLLVAVAFVESVVNFKVFCLAVVVSSSEYLHRPNFEA